MNKTLASIGILPALCCTLFGADPPGQRGAGRVAREAQTPWKESTIPQRIRDGAVKYIAMRWPDVDLQTWHPTIEFSAGSKGAALFKTPHWTLAFDGPPPVDESDGLPFKIEYTGKSVTYILTLDEKEGILAAVVIQQ